MTNLTYKELKEQVCSYRTCGYLPSTTKLNQKREILEQLVIEGQTNRKKQMKRMYADYIEGKYGEKETDNYDPLTTENQSEVKEIEHGENYVLEKSVSESVAYIEFNWHEGYQVIKKNTRFYSWADLHTALKEIADANPLKNNVNHFKKVNVTVHKKNGKTNVRLFCLGLHKHNTDPYKSENVVFKRIPEYAETLKVNQECNISPKVDAEDTYQLKENHQNCVAVFQEFNVNPKEGAEIIAKSEVTSSEVYNIAENTIQLQNNALEMALYGEWVNKMITSGLTSQIVSYDIWLSIRAL